MSWNYRVVKYELGGETLYGLMEVYYSESGEIDGYGSADVINWESPDELSGTLKLMQSAMSQPVLEISGDLMKRDETEH